MSAAPVYVSSVLLAVTFGWSGAVKILRPRSWWSALEVYGFPSAMRRIVWVLVPIAELGLVVLVLLTPLMRVGGALTIAFLAAFCLAILRAHARQGDRLPCGCLGGTTPRDYRLLLLRNVLLLVPAGVVAVFGRAFDESVTAVDPIPALMATAGIAVLAWTALEVTRALKRGRPG